MPEDPTTEFASQSATAVAGRAHPHAPPQVSQDTGFFGHPRGLATLFFTEMWERFSYYGLRPLLILFMSAALAQGGFGFERAQASAIVGIYAACVYLASLPGGWVADRILGLRRAIMLGAVLITAGHFSIGLSGFAVSKVPFFLGLVLIVLGTGLLKPNISAIVGDLYPEGGARRDAGFSIFYMGINLGAFAGQIVTGALGEKVGWHWGFGAAGFGMLLGLLTFIARNKGTLGDLGLEPSRHPNPAVDARQKRTGKLVLLVGLALIAVLFALAAAGVVTFDPQAIGKSMTYVLVGLAVVYFAGVYITGNLTSDEKKRIAVIFVLFVFAAAFWGAFEQAPTSLNLFARDFTNRNFFGFEVPALWFQSINSLFIIMFAPMFAALWVTMARRGMELSSPGKFTLGLLLAAAGFAVMIPAANMIVASGGAVKVSAWWLTISYLLQTLGELSLSPVGLSSMTKLSPRKYVGQMMGIWFLAASVGNLIAGLVGGAVDPEKLEQTPALFTWTTIALLASAAVLGALIIPIRRMMADVRDV
ncbi:MAG: peptide MFS transporter [Gemmatimonadetes bacterium]|nr:peptide MFS transporter [Gemmatimonadota bacterium]